MCRKLGADFEWILTDNEIALRKRSQIFSLVALTTKRRDLEGILNAESFKCKFFLGGAFEKFMIKFHKSFK